VLSWLLLTIQAHGAFVLSTNKTGEDGTHTV